jgi:predicted glycoside hydrolase/deacetylase ChbG (UPF0249 family)
VDTQGIPIERLKSIKKAAPKLLEKFRTPHPIRFIGYFYEELARLETLLVILDRLPAGVSELMCHPGYVDDNLLRVSAYNHQRENELAILTKDGIFSSLKQRGILLKTFGCLLENQQ